MTFTVVGPILDQATIAVGGWNSRGREASPDLRPRQVAQTQRYRYDQFDDGTKRTAEVHWYEAHGIGRKEIKIKRFIS